jgi:hypothetical protein
MEHKIPIPADVLEGLESVRLSGKTNMLDAPRVIELALEMGFPETAFWVYENRPVYAEGIFRGFDVEEGGDAECADR